MCDAKQVKGRSQGHAVRTRELAKEQFIHSITKFTAKVSTKVFW